MKLLLFRLPIACIIFFALVDIMSGMKSERMTMITIPSATSEEKLTPFDTVDYYGELIKNNDQSRTVVLTKRRDKFGYFMASVLALMYWIFPQLQRIDAWTNRKFKWLNGEDSEDDK